MVLGDLFKRYGTDKYSHGYQAFYEEAFGDRREEPLLILEIGTQEGHSTSAFLDYFPNAHIVCLDSFERPITVELDNPRLSYLKANALAPNLHSLVKDVIGDKQFDLIIEDAVKDAAMVRRTMKMLLPLLKAGGMWVLEDQVLFSGPVDWDITQVNMTSPQDAYLKDVLQRTASLTELLDYAQTFGYDVNIYDYRNPLENKNNSILAVIKKPKG